MKKILLGLFALLFISVSAYANELKVGVINLPKIVQQSPQIKSINKNLDAKFKPKREAIIKAQTALRAEAEKFAPNAAKKLTAAERKSLQAKFTEQQKSYQELVGSYQSALNKAQAEAMKEFLGKVNAAVLSIAKKQKLDVVLLKQAVVYAGQEVNITQEVIQQLAK
ncbi:MAG: OmpH family outer membrane protein [Pseudomonadota bacterium]